MIDEQNKKLKSSYLKHFLIVLLGIHKFNFYIPFFLIVSKITQPIYLCVPDFSLLVLDFRLSNPRQYN